MTEQIERQEKVKNKPLRIIFAIMVLLAAIAFAGYIMCIFHNLAYIPSALSSAVKVLCVVFWGFSIGFFVCYIKELYQK